MWRSMESTGVDRDLRTPTGEVPGSTATFSHRIDRVRDWGCPTEGQAEFWGASGGRRLVGTQIWGDMGWSHMDVTRQWVLGKPQ